MVLLTHYFNYLINLIFISGDQNIEIILLLWFLVVLIVWCVFNCINSHGKEQVTDIYFLWACSTVLELKLRNLLFFRDLKEKSGIFLDGFVLLLDFRLSVIIGGLGIQDFCLSIILNLPKTVNIFGQIFHLF